MRTARKAHTNIQWLPVHRKKLSAVCTEEEFGDGDQGRTDLVGEFKRRVALLDETDGVWRDGKGVDIEIPGGGWGLRTRLRGRGAR